MLSTHFISAVHFLLNSGHSRNHGELAPYSSIVLINKIFSYTFHKYTRHEYQCTSNLQTWLNLITVCIYNKPDVKSQVSPKVTKAEIFVRGRNLDIEMRRVCTTSLASLEMAFESRRCTIDGELAITERAVITYSHTFEA